MTEQVGIGLLPVDQTVSCDHLVFEHGGLLLVRHRVCNRCMTQLSQKMDYEHFTRGLQLVGDPTVGKDPTLVFSQVSQNPGLKGESRGYVPLWGGKEKGRCWKVRFSDETSPLKG